MNKQRKKLVPNVIRGGTAIPIGDNFFFMKGRKHEQGGIDIGKDLEVEGGEVMEITPNQMKIYSSVPFLNGNSPAELVMEGVNPNKVFKAQEDFKDRNHINDDGTRKKKSGGMKKIPRAKNGIEYTIKKGDTLSRIAKTLLGDASRYKELAKLNNIDNPDYIQVGQEIIIPESAIGTPQTSKPTRLVSSAEIQPTVISVDLEEENRKKKAREEYIKQHTGFRGLWNTTKDKINDLRIGIEDLGENIGDFGENTLQQLKHYWNRGVNVKLRGKSEDPVTELIIPKAVEQQQSDIMFPSVYGDEIPVNDNLDNQVYRTESILLNGLKFGARNRGDLNKLNTEGALITSLNAFSPYSEFNVANIRPNSSFIGIDKNGNFKAGTIADFEEGDLLAQTSSNMIKGFAKNEDGSYQFVPAVGNSRWDTPLTIAIDETTGKDRIGQAMRTLNQRGSKGDKYGSIEGGRFVVKVGDEYRLISGSVKNIEDEMNRLKKAYDVDSLQVFNLDNGTFNLGYIPTDNIIDENELRNYDAKNQSGGHFLYLKKFGGKKDKFTLENINDNFLYKGYKEDIKDKKLKDKQEFFNIEHPYVEDINRFPNVYSFDIRDVTPRASGGYLDEENGILYNMYNKEFLDAKKDNLKSVTADEIKKYLYKNGLGYIGGDNARLKMISKLPNIVNKVNELSSQYGINPNIFMRRLEKEGFIDEAIRRYNESSINRQNNLINNILEDKTFSPFTHFGLDDAGALLLNGDIQLLNSTNELYTVNARNEKGEIKRTIGSGIPVKDILEIKAAMIKHYGDLIKQRFPNRTDDELNATINAAYNMGPYHKDLNNIDYVMRNYAVGQGNVYENRFGGMKQYRNGGLSRRKDYGSSKKPYPNVKSSDFAGGNRSYPIPTKADAVDALRLAGLHGRSDVKTKVYRKYPELRNKKPLGGGAYYDFATNSFKRYTDQEPGGLLQTTPLEGNNFRLQFKPITLDIPNFNINTSNLIDKTSKKENKRKPFGETIPVVTPSSVLTDKAAALNDNAKILFEDRLKQNIAETAERNRNKRTKNGTDYTSLVLNGIGALGNIGGNIASSIINGRMIDQLEYSPEPIPLLPTKLKTRININPQLQRLYTDLGLMTDAVNNNTASSRTALARNQRLRNQTRQAVNELYGNKENIETQLINRDRLNQQQVALNNVQQYNRWRQGLADFNNEIANLRAENKVATTQGIVGAVTDLISAIGQNNLEARNLSYLQRSNPYAVDALSPDAMAALNAGNGYIRLGRCGGKFKSKKR